MPLTTPDDEPTVAIVASLLLHVPPVVISDNVVVDPTQTEAAPVIADGSALTVSDLDVTHPADVVYVIFTVPADAPVTSPVALLTVATEVLLLLHVPPVVASVNVVVEPTHTADAPLIAAGSGLTVIVVVVKQLALNE